MPSENPLTSDDGESALKGSGGGERRYADADMGAKTSENKDTSSRRDETGAKPGLYCTVRK
ncbi:hypothetical protein TRAPUB_12294 [Trametes pubescens]|uniref:Uncharacterized protein n=1 Tax=Trametes pubescens TaxID=154538 RepID=A0A1M2VUB1_TRAPU|nr:hypothetical protein TRAPUB_12294 [Trametes pubescens]